MNQTEKEISYTTTNSYSTLNALTSKTKTVWFVCHGMGYLSRYFLKYFNELNKEENYIIAPQAPSKYYITPKFYVGANWLTKDNTLKNNENIMQYFDAIFEAERIAGRIKLIVLGYSQGVSVALRYLVKRQLKCHKLIIHSGGIPKELTSQNFAYLDAQVTLTYGINDEYLDKHRIKEEIERASELFGKRLNVIPFDGKHEVNVSLLNEMV